jgi:hypothetical protein
MYDPLKQWDLPQWVPSYGVILPTFDAPKIDTRFVSEKLVWERSIYTNIHYTIDSL